MKIRTVLVFFYPLLIVIVVTLLLFMNLTIHQFTMVNWMNFLENELKSDFESKVLLEQEKAEIVVKTLLKDKNILEAFEKKDRQKLIEYVMSYAEIYKDSGIYQIHFHDENVVSFLRTSNLEKYGDDLKGYRKDIIRVKETKQPVYSISVGAMGAMIRYIVPVIVEKKYIGSVEANVKIEKTFAQKFSGDVIIKLFFDENKNKVDLVNKSRQDMEDFTTLFDEKRILEGKIIKFMKGGYVYISFPIKDYNGDVFAAFYRKIDAKSLHRHIQVNTVITVSVSLALLILSIYLSRKIAKNFEKRLQHLVSEVHKISEGNLNLELSFKTDDEISNLGENIRIATEKLKMILSEIKQLTNRSISKDIQLSKISENVVAAASSASEIMAMSENTEKASIELDKSIEEFAAYLQESRAEVEVTVQKIKDFTDTIEKITTSYSQLTDLVETLGNLAEKITEIADNITVLAINASIETSKQMIDRDGLSRIAEMIMELSNASRTLAKESKISLDSVEKTVTNTVLVTEKIIKDLTGVRDSLDLISNVTSALTQNVEKLIKISKTTHNSVEQMYGGVEQLEESIVNIKVEIENLSKSFKEIIEAFRKLEL
ncbi:MAG: methyl-accepting chemotaxis protein [Fervidobacterium sp.]|nr:methyl-accepting chemotaxis protein [Fervidobacterium sp.]